MHSRTPKTVAFKPGERNIFFHILTACNLSCKHCYINPDQHGTSTVSKDMMMKWLEMFFDPGKENNLIFLGGEPTLHPDLAEGIKAANRLGYHSVTVDSNGFLFNNLLDKITPSDAVLSFSLDGPTPEINDPLRGDGVFDTCTANIRQAVDKGFQVSVIYTVSRLNIDHLHKMPKLLTDLGIKRFFIQVIGIRGKSADDSQPPLQLTAAEWLKEIPPVVAEAASKGIDVIYPKVFLEEDEHFQCAGNVAKNYFIFPNGRVYLCPLCEDYPINTFRIENNCLVRNEGIIEEKLFSLNIPEGCVINKMLQPSNITYDKSGKPAHRISCCLLKQEMKAFGV